MRSLLRLLAAVSLFAPAASAQYNADNSKRLQGLPPCTATVTTNCIPTSAFGPGGHALPAGTIVGTTDTQALTNKTVDGLTPTQFGYLTLDVGSPYVTFYGAGAGNPAIETGLNDVAIGDNALAALTTGNNNTAIGTSAMVANTIGAGNVGMGQGVLQYLNGGGYNVAVGNQAASTLVGGGDVTAVGYYALSLGSGSYNTALGYQAGYGPSGTNANTTGTYNTYLGYNTAASSTTQQTYQTIVGAAASAACSSCIVLGRSTDVTQVGSVAYASLPPVPAAGSLIYCNNCTTAATCTSGGSGHLAVSNGSAFTCQ